jgi:glutathione S-transferase
LRWLFFLTSAISSPATELAFNRVAVKFSGGSPDEAAIARGEKTLPDPLRVVENHLANQKWMLGEFSLVDCDYGPTFNVLDKAGSALAISPTCARTSKRFVRAAPGRRPRSCPGSKCN